MHVALIAGFSCAWVFVVKAPTYRRVIRDINHRYDPHFDSIRNIDKKWRNTLIESDHAAMKRLPG